MIIKFENKLFYSMEEIETAADIASGDDGRMAKKIKDILAAFTRELSQTDERLGLYKEMEE